MARVIIPGISVSTGIAIGKAFFLNRNRTAHLPRLTVAEEAVAHEAERLAQAFLQAEDELAAARDKVPAELKEHRLIIDSHLMMLKDPKLRNAARAYITDMRLNAEWALEKALGDLEKTFGALDDVYIRERMQDVRFVIVKVQSHLIGQDKDLRSIEGRVIIMAHDLTPADTVELDVNKILGFATVQGGKTSHTGIMARTLGIPAMVGVADLESHVLEGDFVIIDGLSGKIVIDPDEDELTRYNELSAQFEDYTRRIIRECQLPAETSDGYRVQVLANIELLEEVAAVLDRGGEGIGLYRTEYSYLNRTDLPSEEELAEKYSDLVSIMSPRRVIFRTLDLGADKFIQSFGSLEEPNPALGMRAIRFCLRHPDLFRTQLRAVCRASAYGNASIMFPMISGLKELRRAKSLLRDAQDELRREGIPFNEEMPVGIMVELPSAVMIAEFLAEECDFFSIGTNDLIQYSVGIDRTNRHVSYLYQPLHPAVLRAIKHVTDAAHQAGIEVSLCGEVASDPFCVPIIMGMQVDSISLTPQAIPGIKRVIRQARMTDCRDLLREVLSCRTVGRVNRLVKETIFKRFPEELTFFASLLDNEEHGG
ncbi:MAG TPA: phosphoenolpyruvate--protein phosphotransferase [Desulfovibrio sp.]|uniref:phosphoenolpyruvate--protein phosphotransferase n=1 Tax=Desulfovibrio TaxID=872 RepID=UPI000401F2E4|nr:MULTISPECIES: phosphoenolpyruvate--protein phosphotransferase [Desulfovibrio]HMM37553.1 phosphoenolpyruvate--protein phosphotransferase [Desulfovibrio sp.]